MSQTILIKKSAVASKAPTAEQLTQGELAVNTADALLYSKHSDGTVVKLTRDTLSEMSEDETHRVVTDTEKSTWNGKVDSLGDLSVTATATELNKLDGFTGTYTDLNYAKDLKATGVTTTEFDYLDGVTSNIQTQLNAKAGTGTNTFTGQQTFNDVVVHKVNATDASIDCSTGNYFTDTVSANTTYSFVSVPSGFLVIVLELYDGGDYTVTWPSSVKWPADTAPTLTSNGYDVLTFYTDDGGTTWRGMLSMGDSK